MTNHSVRPSPAIPDHEVLRKIGGGSYGEVWLARGVTGALRAVKVVWREDFEDDRTFEREFDGILKFEPISRDHPGLVNILHVGRSTGEESFYYYVMELGDDVQNGRDINPVEYEALTLREDHHEGPADQWPLEECIDIGLRLAEALQHLHENGLAHRDVKPSNVIFVNGKAKLADIGLVAARGQRTFVGTEGFVPPEGPGSAKADIYSLGKVLYEITTGMDRMNFPELPEDMPSGNKRKLWLELNRIICEVCEPRITKRKISSAEGLANALRRLQGGKRRRPHGISVALTSLFLVTAAGWGGWQVVKDSEWIKNLRGQPQLPQAVEVNYRIFSTPEGADVFNESGEFIGTTPTETMTGVAGEEIRVTLRKDGYRVKKVVEVITESSGEEQMTVHRKMDIFSPPKIGEPWTDQYGQLYQPDDKGHLSANYINRELWKHAIEPLQLKGKHYEFLNVSEKDKGVDIVLTSRKMADRFSSWMRNEAINEGFLTDDHEIQAVWERSYSNKELSDSAREKNFRPFRLRVDPIDYAQLYVTTHPMGAELFVDDISRGRTYGETFLEKVKPGERKIELVLEGYKPITMRLLIEDGGFHEVHETMEKNQGVVFGRPWRNGLDMEFVPLGEDLMVSVYETRVQDYRRFLRLSKYPEPKEASFKEEEKDGYPVVNVSREDARAFCDWLTEWERARDRISQNHEYRLPSDLEWSLMAGLTNEDPDASPSTRDALKRKVFPWGEDWPEDSVPGNFADKEAAKSPDIDENRTISGYDDSYAHTAPVGSYAPNDLGIYDLSGNVQEWVNDPYSKQVDIKLGVLRGGGWNTYQLENLYSGSRNAAPIAYADEMYGFRVVLARKPVAMSNMAPQELPE